MTGSPPRIAVVGAESTGKSMLAVLLADHFGGRSVPEFGREAQAWADPEYVARPEHMVEIAEAQLRLVDEAAALRPPRPVFSDTDAVTTLVWSEFYLRSVPEEVRAAADRQRFDLHLLLSPDVRWIADGVRSWEDTRERFDTRLEAELVARGARWTRISGPWPGRTRAAVRAVRSFLDGL